MTSIEVDDIAVRSMSATGSSVPLDSTSKGWIAMPTLGSVMTMAFLDGDPAIRGQSIVIPNSHETFLLTAEESIAKSVLQSVRALVHAVAEAFDIDGTSLFYPTPGHVGQVTHVHVHLLSRYTGDQIRLASSREPLDDEVDEIPQEIREHV